MSSSAKPISALDLGWMAVAITVGVAVLSYRLGWQDFWWDEQVTLMFTRSTWHELLVTQWSLDTHRPIYYALQKGWNGIFGESTAAIRSLPIILSIPMIPIFYLVARRTLMWPAAPIAALMIATAPMFLLHGREIRMYSLMNLCLSLSLFITVILIERTRKEPKSPIGRDVCLWLALAATHAVAFYAQAMAVIVTASFGIWVLLGSALRLIPPVFLGRALATFAVYLVLLIPAILPFFNHLGGTLGENFWIPDPTLEYLYEQVAASYDVPFWGKALAGLALLWGLWCMPRQSAGSLLIILMVIGVPVLLLMVSFFKPVFLARTVAWATMCACFVMAAGLASLRPLALRWVGIGSLVATQVAGILQFYPSEPEVPTVAPFASAFHTFDPTVDGLFLGDQLYEPELRFYYPHLFEAPAFAFVPKDFTGFVINDAMVSTFVYRADAVDVPLPVGRSFVVRSAENSALTEDTTDAALAIMLSNATLIETIEGGELRLEIYVSEAP